MAYPPIIREGLTKGQAKLLRILGPTFLPVSEDDLCRAYYPNHHVWVTMGQAGRQSWGGLLGQISRMIGALERQELVWQVAPKWWAVSSRVDKEAASHYFEWLQVQCDELQGGSDPELETAAVESLCYFLSTYSVVVSSWRDCPIVAAEGFEPTLITVLRAIVHYAPWDKKEGRSAIAGAVNFTLRHNQQLSAFTPEVRGELHNSLYKVFTKAGSGTTAALLRETLQRLGIQGDLMAVGGGFYGDLGNG